MKRIATYAELAQILHLPPGSLRSMVARKSIPHVRVSPRVVLFDLDVIDAWLAERAIGVKAVTP